MTSERTQLVRSRHRRTCSLRASRAITLSMRSTYSAIALPSTRHVVLADGCGRYLGRPRRPQAGTGHFRGHLPPARCRAGAMRDGGRPSGARCPWRTGRGHAHDLDRAGALARGVGEAAVRLSTHVRVRVYGPVAAIACPCAPVDQIVPFEGLLAGQPADMTSPAQSPSWWRSPACPADSRTCADALDEAAEIGTDVFA